MLKLSTQAQEYLGRSSSEKFHEAMYDVEVLEKLVLKNIAKETLLKKSQLFHAPLLRQSLEPLREAVSLRMIERIANVGIGLQQLEQIFQRNGRDGIVQLLSEELFDEISNTRKPRVTKDKKVSNKIIAFFTKKKLKYYLYPYRERRNIILLFISL